MVEETEFKTLPVKSVWNFYFHAIDEKSFAPETFKLIMKIRKIEDAFALVRKMPTFESGMFFLIKDPYPPKWDDPSNINGGMWTYKINKSSVNETFERLIYLTITDNLCKDILQKDHINGISTSPKLHNVVVKIWTVNTEVKDAKKKFIKVDGLDHESTFFRLNREPAFRPKRESKPSHHHRSSRMYKTKTY